VVVFVAVIEGQTWIIAGKVVRTNHAASNVLHPSAAAREREGPISPCACAAGRETAPFCPAGKGTRERPVARALALIESGALDSGTIDAHGRQAGHRARHLLDGCSRASARFANEDPRWTHRMPRAKRLTRLTSDLPIGLIAEGAQAFKASRRMSAALLRLLRTLRVACGRERHSILQQRECSDQGNPPHARTKTYGTEARYNAKRFSGLEFVRASRMARYRSTDRRRPLGYDVTEASRGARRRDRRAE